MPRATSLRYPRMNALLPCAQFRKNAMEADPRKVAEQRQVAMKGLEQLKMYTTLDKDSLNW